MTSVQVIIPYYKEFDYFHESLISVINQDYKNFSIMVIDDGTKDDRVVQLISSLQDNRITLIQNENNLGLSRNFEFARTQASAALDFIK
jgi:GT2 family glycosyltransferase